MVFTRENHKGKTEVKEMMFVYYSQVIAPTERHLNLCAITKKKIKETLNTTRKDIALQIQMWQRDKEVKINCINKVLRKG